MKVYGYARVSTKQQNIERQIRNIKEIYPEAIIVTDSYTGTRLDRPGWSRLYKQLKPGDVVVFDQVSRMSRDAEEGFEVYQTLYNLGVDLRFIKEPHINTETYRKALESGVPLTGTNVDYILEGVNKYLMSLAKEQIRLAFEQAQKEVDDLHQRTREGIETARLNGKQIGQPKGARLVTKKSIKAKELIRKHSKDFDGTLPDADVMKLIGCARGSYYKWKRELRPYKLAMRGEELREKFLVQHEGYIEKEVLRRLEYAENHGQTLSRRKVEKEVMAEVSVEADKYVEECLSKISENKKDF